MDNYIALTMNLKSFVNKMVTDKCTIQMYIFGSTKGASQFPKHCSDICEKGRPPEKGELKMLTRPLKHYRPGSKAWNYMQEPWFVSMVHYLARMTKTHIQMYKNKSSSIKTIEENIQYIESNIPNSLRICNSFFTQMVLNTYEGDEDKKHISIHLDEKDMISCILTLGNPVSGGNTQYYSGLNVKKSKSIIHEVEFEHGQIQISQFNKLVHSVSPWKGNRFTLNFNVKIPVVQHFQVEGSRYYKSYERSNYKDKLICFCNSVKT